jgi:hypothetical protein
MRLAVVALSCASTTKDELGHACSLRSDLRDCCGLPELAAGRWPYNEKCVVTATPQTDNSGVCVCGEAEAQSVWQRKTRLHKTAEQRIGAA